MNNDTFSDPHLAAMAAAVAQGNAQEIREQAVHVHPDTPGEKGATLLVEAVAHGQAVSVQALLDAGADPNRAGAGGETPMHAAAFADDPALLQMLLAHGGDPNVRNRVTGEVPLTKAILGFSDAQMHMLLEAGADPDAPDLNGGTPLHAAGAITAGAAILALLKAGASPLVKNTHGETFQSYYFQAPKERLNPRALDERKQVIAWLKANGIPLEANVTE